MLEGIFTSRSKTFFFVSFLFLVGISFGSFTSFNIHPPLFYFSSLIFVFLALYSREDPVLRGIFLCLLFFTLGFWRFSAAVPDYSYSERWSEKEYYTAVIDAEPDVRIEKIYYRAKIESDSFSGRVQFSHSRYPRFHYGDEVSLYCKLEKPEPFDSFAYDKYLASKKIKALCHNPEVSFIQKGQGNPFFHYIFQGKDIIAERIAELWHEPYASFMAGLLYGYRGGLGSLNEDFNRSGVTHIVAISGYNITIVVSLFLIILINLGISRQRGFYIILFGIFVFVIFAGASASVVRAGIMGVLILTSKQIGRRSNPRNILIATAALMCLQNPYVLIYDAGFQLSFLSTIGLIYLNPLFEFGYRDFLSIKESFFTTLSATVITLPLILFQFERLSIVAILVNVLILWIIPFIMMIGFAAVMLSFISNLLGSAFASLAFFGMKYIVVIVEYFARKNYAVTDVSFSFVSLVLSYVFLYIFYQVASKE